MAEDKRKPASSQRSRRGDDLQARLAETERALAQSERRCQALAESEQRYRSLFELASDFFWETDADNRLTYLSPNSEAITGLPFSAYKGRRLSETEGVALDRDAGRASVAIFKTRQPFRDFVYSRRRRDGTVVWISSSGEPIFDAAGAFRGYRGIARDVTARIEADLALRRSEERYRQLVEVASEWFWELDPAGRFTFLSTNVVAMFGRPISYYLGRRADEIEGVVIEPKAGRANLAAIKARQPYRDFVHRHTLSSGKFAYISSSGSPFYDQSGAFLGYRGISRDVTAQVEAENKLRENERHFRQLFETYSDYYWEEDARHYTTLFWPESKVEEIYGTPAAAFYGRRFSQFLNISPDPEGGRRVLIAYKKRQPYRDLVISVKRADGTTRWVSICGAPKWDADGTFCGFRGIGLDITTRVEAEAAIRLAERQLHDAVTHIGQPFAVFNGDARIVAYNQAFADLYRTPEINTPVIAGVSFRSLAEWQLKTGFFTGAADERPVDIATLLEHYRSGREDSFHLRDGRWMMAVYRPLPGDGKVALWTDVTTIKRAEEERRSLEAQLQHSQRLEALGTLAGGAAHEINNALVPVIALTQMMARKVPEDSRERRNFDAVLAGAHRSRDLVKQILAFSRNEEHRTESVDVAALLCDALRLMRATVATSIGFVEEIAAVPPIMGDRNQLHQVIVNLVTNAAQAIGETHGTITVGSRTDADGAARLWVADTGCGMDAATKARIFEPFFTTKEVGKGTGLGLSVVHGIVKEHGGRIEVESAPDRGTRFDIVLPPLAAARAGAAA
jgi:two-component system cell cycle sensor histidine kinase/response regulator CckA